MWQSSCSAVDYLRLDFTERMNVYINIGNTSANLRRHYSEWSTAHCLVSIQVES